MKTMHIRRELFRLCSWWIVTLVCMGCAHSTEDDMMTLHGRILDYYLEVHPTRATFLGDERHIDKLAQFSTRALSGQRDMWESFSNSCKRLGQINTDRDLRMDNEAIQALIESEILYLTEWAPFRNDPGIYADEIMRGITFAAIRGSISPKTRLFGLRARMSDVTRLVQESKSNLNNCPDIWIDLALETLDGAESYFEQILAFITEQLPDSQQDAEIDANNSAMEQARSTLKTFRGLLQQLREKDHGVFSGLGKELFRKLLWARHRWNYPIDELAVLGHNGIADTKRELRKLSESKGYGSDWKAMLEEAAARQPDVSSVLQVYQEAVGKARQFVEEQHLVPMPPDDYLEIVETPEFERPGTPVAAYWDPELLVSKGHGTFMVTVPRGSDREMSIQMREHCYGAIASTVVHEAYPGHQLQVAWSIQAKSRVRRMMEVLSFAEGWALYGEKLMAERGFLNGDALVFHLRDKLLRAVRVVIEINIHTGAMTFDEAVDFLSEETGIDRGTANGEVSWYSREPTTPLSYFIGMLDVTALRKDYAEKCGALFNPYEFHRELLACGTLPIPVIRDYIIGVY